MELVVRIIQDQFFSLNNLFGDCPRRFRKSLLRVGKQGGKQLG